MGATVVKRNFFSATVAHPGGAVTLAALKRIAGWGFVPDANNVPTSQKSADSFMSNAATIIPTSDVYVGHDEFVRDAAAAGPPVLYRGSLATGGQPYTLPSTPNRSIVDDNAVYIYSAAGQDIEVITQGI